MMEIGDGDVYIYRLGVVVMVGGGVGEVGWGYGGVRVACDKVVGVINASMKVTKTHNPKTIILNHLFRIIIYNITCHYIIFVLYTYK